MADRVNRSAGVRGRPSIQAGGETPDQPTFRSPFRCRCGRRTYKGTGECVRCERARKARARQARREPPDLSPAEIDAIMAAQQAVITYRRRMGVVDAAHTD